jgi:F0F1-type ATP synthase assembly protein I
MRWKPVTYPQAWLVALGVFAIIFLVGLAAGGRPYGLVSATILGVAAGTAESVRVRRRRITARRRPGSPSA